MSESAALGGGVSTDVHGGALAASMQEVPSASAAAHTDAAKTRVDAAPTPTADGVLLEDCSRVKAFPLGRPPPAPAQRAP